MRISPRASLLQHAIWILLLGCILSILSYKSGWLDSRLYYSPWEALGYLSLLEPHWHPRLMVHGAIDLLLFIPLYFFFGWRLIELLKNHRLLPLFFLCVGTAADILETISGFIALQGKGWESGFVPNILSLSTPLKWAALALSMILFGALWWKQQSKSRLY